MTDLDEKCIYFRMCFGDTAATIVFYLFIRCHLRRCYSMYHCWGYLSARGDRKHAQPHGLALSRSAENTIFSTITSEHPYDLPIYQHLVNSLTF